MPCFGRPIKVLPEGQKDERSSDQILDDYLANTSYYQQTWLSIDAAASSVWRKQVRVRDGQLPQTTKSQSYEHDCGEYP